ncbi:hypothetical protein Hanom_Chr02g00120621 [Helianthus anomalus]
MCTKLYKCETRNVCKLYLPIYTKEKCVFERRQNEVVYCILYYHKCDTQCLQAILTHLVILIGDSFSGYDLLYHGPKHSRRFLLYLVLNLIFYCPTLNLKLNNLCI